MELILGRLFIRQISIKSCRFKLQRFSSIVKMAGNEDDAPSLSENPKKRSSNSNEIYISGKHAIEETTRILASRLYDLKDVPLIEVNPGRGHLTRGLIHAGFSSIKLIESDPNYRTDLEELKNEHPDKVDYSIENFFTLWKLAFQDNLDGGSRIETLFHFNAKKTPHSDIFTNIVGALPSMDFIWHILLSLINQSSIFSLGRPNFYLWMIPSHYYSLVTDENCIYRANFYYRKKPVLFNVLFNHEILSEISQTEFLPQIQKSTKNVKTKPESKFSNLDKDYMYLVHISVKENLPFEYDTLPIFHYFCKHHLRNKSNRVIPMFEQWIPGCGIWLITGQDPVGTCVVRKPTENDVPLPHITIFTQFSDFNPGQIVTLFKRFYSWPEFEQSSFKEAFENSLYKGLTSDIANQEDETNDPAN